MDELMMPLKDLRRQSASWLSGMPVSLQHAVWINQ